MERTDARTDGRGRPPMPDIDPHSLVNFFLSCTVIAGWCSLLAARIKVSSSFLPMLIELMKFVILRFPFNGAANDALRSICLRSLHSNKAIEMEFHMELKSIDGCVCVSVCCAREMQ